MELGAAARPSSAVRWPSREHRAGLSCLWVAFAVTWWRESLRLSRSLASSLGCFRSVSFRCTWVSYLVSPRASDLKRQPFMISRVSAGWLGGLAAHATCGHPGRWGGRPVWGGLGRLDAASQLGRAPGRGTGTHGPFRSLSLHEVCCGPLGRSASSGQSWSGWRTLPEGVDGAGGVMRPSRLWPQHVPCWEHQPRTRSLLTPSTGRAPPRRCHAGSPAPAKTPPCSSLPLPPPPASLSSPAQGQQESPGEGPLTSTTSAHLCSLRP